MTFEGGSLVSRNAGFAALVAGSFALGYCSAKFDSPHVGTDASMPQSSECVPNFDPRVDRSKVTVRVNGIPLSIDVDRLLTESGQGSIPIQVGSAPQGPSQYFATAFKHREYMHGPEFNVLVYRKDGTRKVPITIARVSRKCMQDGTSGAWYVQHK